MMCDKRLQWVQENNARRGRSSAEVIGDLVKTELNRCTKEIPVWRRQVVDVLNEVGGAELMERVDLINLRRGVLKFQVIEAGERYRLRIRWEQRLLAALQVRVPAAGIHTIRFVAGGEAEQGSAATGGRKRSQRRGQNERT